MNIKELENVNLRIMQIHSAYELICKVAENDLENNYESHIADALNCLNEYLAMQTFKLSKMIGSDV